VLIQTTESITNLIKVSAVGKSSWVTFTCPTKQLVWPLLIEKDWPSTPKSFRSSKIPVLVKGPPSDPILLISFRYVTTTYRIRFLSKEHLSFLFCNFFYPAGSILYTLSVSSCDDYCHFLVCKLSWNTTVLLPTCLVCFLWLKINILHCFCLSCDYLTLIVGHFIVLVRIFAFPCITVAFTENSWLILVDYWPHWEDLYWR